MSMKLKDTASINITGNAGSATTATKATQDASGNVITSTYATKTELSGKIDKVSGKGLSTNDFTSALKTKLESLSNYDDTELSNAIDSLSSRIDTLVSGDASTAIESFNEIVSFLENIEDTESLEGIIAGIESKIPTKVSQLTNDEGYLTSVATANGTTLGLVKGGGDVTITSGVITVNDDSHAHIISNVDGLQSALDGKASTAVATTSSAGLMSAADKAALDGLVNTGGEVNQNAFSNVTVGSTTIAADSKTDTLTLAAGSNITLTPDATNDKITIAAKDTTYSAATTEAAGLMSASDKTKLDGIAAGANAYTHPSHTSKTSGLYKITVDSQGHVSAATAVAKSDITALGIPGSDTNTDTKVTSVGNHYTPSANSDSAISVDASSTTAATWGSTSLVTGVNLERDAAGHVTGMTVDSIKMPSNPNTNTTYTFAGGTNKFTVTPSGGTAQDVTVTPSISKNVTYTGTLVDEQVAAFEGTSGTIKASGYTIAASVPSGAKFTDTDTKVTSVGNHYTPSADSASELSADASSSTAATWGSTDLVTGVNIQRDAKGHVTGVTVDSIQMPSNPNSNTIPSAYCTTAAGTAAKTASCSGYVLTANTYLHLIVTAANTAASALTLNVNGKGAKNIYINGSASSSSNYTLPAGSYIVFYDGTQYQLRTDGVLPGKILAAKDADTVNGLTVLTAVPANAKFTDNNTTYTAGKGLTLSSTTFNVGAGTGISVADDTVGLATSGVTAGTYGDDEDTRTLTHSDVFDVPQITVDAYGRVTSASTKTLTLPASGNTDTKVTSVGNHYTPAEDTSAAISAASGTATNITGTAGKLNVVTGVKRDAKGHIVGVTSANIYSTDNNTTYSAISSDELSTGTATTSRTVTAAVLGPWVKSQIDSKIAAADAMIYKGTIGSSGATVTELPSTTAKTGWTYKVITAGTYASVACEVGDMIICLTDGSSSTAATWTVVQNNIDGAVTGPSSSTDAHVAVFNGATGKVIKDSGYTIAKSVPSNAVFTDTNTKVTSVGNHYTPAENTGSAISAADGTATNVTGTSGKLNVVTGLKRDAAGHVVGVTSANIYSTDNNTTYSAATTSAAGLMSANDKAKLDGITSSADSVSFTQSLTSGTKVGTITINGTGTDLYCQTNTNTTYSAGTGLSLSSTTFNHSNSVTAKTAYGSTATTASANGGTIKVTDVQYDAQGHITASTDRTITLSQDHTKTSVTAGTAGTSSATSGASLAVPYVTVNANGHVTGYGTHTHTISGFLTSHQTIKQDGVTGATANRYAACSTAAATAAKTASVTAGTFNLEAGARVTVKFANANTAGTPTLNINSKGAKNIFHKGSQITTGSNKSLLAGAVDFIYDGTQWHLVGNYIDTNTTYSSKAAASGGTDVSLVTTGEKYTWNSKTSNTGTVTSVATGAGLTGGSITTSGTIKCKLKSETASTLDSAAMGSTASRQYAVGVDKSGYLSVNVPWSNTTYSSKSAASGGTDVSLVTTGEKYTWNSKTSNTGTVTSITLTQGTGISIGSSGTAITTSGTRTISLATVLSAAANAGPTAAVTGSHGTTVAIPRISVDTYGRVTALTSYNLTCQNTTYSVATASANGLMAAADKSLTNFLNNYTTATTLASLNVGYSLIYATLSAATSISLSGTLSVGRSITVVCNPTASFTQAIPTSGSYISMDGDSLSVTSGKPFEINILCYASGKYSISCKTAA